MAVPGASGKTDILVPADYGAAPGAYPAPGQVAGQVPGFNPEKQFTIVQINPDAGKEEVRIVFSQPIPLEVIRPKLQLVPPVKINWEKSTVSDEGVLTLRGAFKFGSNYVLNLPDTFTYNRRTYIKSRNSFFLPDMAPRAEFIDQKSVIERDSRQLLQVRVRNLDSADFGRHQGPANSPPPGGGL